MGVALIVRDVGVSHLLCFYSGRRDVCIYLLSLLGGCFKVVEIGRVPPIVTKIKIHSRCEIEDFVKKLIFARCV